MKEDLLKIIKKYGLGPQLKHFQSEVFELNEAIIRYDEAENNYFEGRFDNGCGMKEHIAEEIADCCVMIGQFKNYYEITDEELEKICLFKIKRQLERIEREAKKE